ncbi:hypothetical protein B0H15DRAFT_849777 [Mycena belliarum]|uniref:SHSP domain-containing protein n=1 Tax=Mycena belliarum TaxID=1033014 RepID=A0AAD6XSD0_9AGAR|nr:hypothetical protein B0H15DRAFT_849777 [Mycena belliae]
MAALHKPTLRSMSGPCSQRHSAPKSIQSPPPLQVLHAPATKAGTFGLLSACANRRVPSRVSRRSSLCGEDSTYGPWVHKARRSSQACMVSRSRARSVRVPISPSVAPSSDLRSDVHSLYLPSASVSQNLASFLCLPARSPTFAPLSPLPVVSTLDRSPPSEPRRCSLMARARRVPSPSRYPAIDIISSAAQYTFHVDLPIAIKPEMVTISTAKGDKVKIVADAWHLEADCHFEWEIAFGPQDVNTSTIRAKLDEEGHLIVSAGRIGSTS